MDGTPRPPENGEHHDDLAALDFSSTDGALEDDGTDLDALHALTDVEDAEVDLHLSTVTNPPATVSVSAFMDGRIHQVELSAKVTRMTESDLAEEVLIIAELARRKARSAQYTFVLDNMGETDPGDREMLRAFVGQSLQLPSPEQAAAAEAQVFATRYAADDNDD